MSFDYKTINAEENEYKSMTEQINKNIENLEAKERAIMKIAEFFNIVNSSSIPVARALLETKAELITEHVKKFINENIHIEINYYIKKIATIIPNSNYTDALSYKNNNIESLHMRYTKWLYDINDEFIRLLEDYNSIVLINVSF